MIITAGLYRFAKSYRPREVFMIASSPCRTVAAAALILVLAACATDRSDISKLLGKANADPAAAAASFTSLDEAFADLESTPPEVRADALDAMVAIDLKWDYAHTAAASHQRLLTLLDAEERSPRLPTGTPLAPGLANRAQVGLRAHALNGLGRLRSPDHLERMIAALGDATAGDEVALAAINGIAGQLDRVRADQEQKMRLLRRLAAQLQLRSTFAPDQTGFVLGELLDLATVGILIGERTAAELPVFMAWNGQVLADLVNRRPVDPVLAGKDIANMLALLDHEKPEIRGMARGMLSTHAPSAWFRRLTSGAVTDVAAPDTARSLAGLLAEVGALAAIPSANENDALVTLPNGRLVLSEGGAFAAEWPALRRQGLQVLLAQSRGVDAARVRTLWAAALAADPLALAGWIEPDPKAFPPDALTRYLVTLAADPAVAGSPEAHQRVLANLAACLTVPSEPVRREVAVALLPVAPLLLARSALSTLTNASANEPVPAFDALAVIAVAAAHRALAAEPTPELNLGALRAVFVRGGAGVPPAVALLVIRNPDLLVDLLVAERLAKGTAQPAELLALSDLVISGRLAQARVEASVTAMTSLVDAPDEDVALTCAACVATVARQTGKPMPAFESRWASVRQLATLPPPAAK